MIKEHKLLIDQDCPMCRAYGQCFTKFNLVEGQTLAPYQTIESQYADHIDMDRARNEIALFDQISKTTLYGYDALVAIITQGCVLTRKVLNVAPIRWIFQQLYFFISYNRKVIIPARPTEIGRNCVPDVQPFYRYTYIVFVALTTGYILNHFVYLVSESLDQPFDPYREYIVCIGQVIWQGVAISLIVSKKRLDYLGNMSTVSMMGGLLLIPILLINSFMSLPIEILAASFGVIVLFMLMEHIRRCILLEVPFALTISWILFRVIVLIVIVCMI